MEMTDEEIWEIAEKAQRNVDFKVGSGPGEFKTIKHGLAMVAIRAVKDAATAAQDAELTRLTAEVAQKDEIIHQLWHLFDDSEERRDMDGCVTINVEASQFALISELLSEEHPVDPRAEEIAQKDAEVARLRGALQAARNSIRHDSHCVLTLPHTASEVDDNDCDCGAQKSACAIDAALEEKA